MIFIPKYPIIEAFEVADTLETFSNQLMDLNIPYSKIVCDKQTIDNKIVEGYTIHSKNDKNFVFVQKGSLIFSKDGILHIIEDMDAFYEMYEKSEKEIIRKKCKNKEKFVCSQCGYIDTKQFEECPNCGSTSESCNNMQATTKVCLRKKKKETTMENKNDDLTKAREEALLEEDDTKVTAVYGDSVTSDANTSNNK
jgi:hypothetical protein